MKILKTLCLLAFAAVMPAMLTSCGDDDDPSSSASGPAFGLRDCGKVISSIQGGYAFSFCPIFFVYDGSGRVVKSNQEDSYKQETVSYDYNNLTGKVVDTKYENNYEYKFSFDADANGRFNNLTREEDYDKTAYEFKYNSDGNVISVVEKNYYESELRNTIYYTFVWDGDLLTSVRHSYGYDITYEYEMKITYSDVVNTYRIPLYGLNDALFHGDLYPNELSIAPAKLPMKIEYYERGEVKDEVMCKYTVDDDGFIEKEYVGGYGSGNIYYTYADKEF